MIWIGTFNKSSLLWETGPHDTGQLFQHSPVNHYWFACLEHMLIRCSNIDIEIECFILKKRLSDYTAKKSVPN